ncbi:MAG: FitA-like ribbon-helix-helix domain-containing protein [Blastocatellia bacterium]
MPDVFVRDVEESVLEKLKDHARRNGRSLQSEVLAILNTFAALDTLSDEETAAVIRGSLRDRVFSDSADLLREDRSR